MDYFPRLKKISLYPYDPVKTKRDLERLLRLPYRPKDNPFIPLPEWSPTMPKEKVTIQLGTELEKPDESSSRFFEARIVSGPDNLNLPRDRDVIVEIYDPYSYNGLPIWPQHGFTHTIASYRKLEHLQGTRIPKYYGSYVMVTPSGRQKNRQIPVILRELIDGTNMFDLEAEDYSTETRQVIMEEVIAAERELDKGGVSLARSLSSYAFILVEEDTKFRIVVWLFPYTTLDPTAGDIFIRPGGLPVVLLKWKTALLEEYSFDWFVDWPWVPWLYEKYRHELEEIYVTDRLVEEANGFDKQIKWIGGLDKQIVWVGETEQCSFPGATDEKSSGDSVTLTRGSDEKSSGGSASLNEGSDGTSVLGDDSAISAY
ncbi:hypothetical protein TRVA0_030S01002 [Trichomonascus vanleenenianus]|uniref:uncharacterized protein n=1 Tax=Trichomonascus vanleenenianus TaxID=2268995 RepID=UPI003EC9B1BC